jgi:Uroporphyrinogen-III synthase HemD
LENLKILLARAEGAPEVLAQELTRLGAIVAEAVAYRTVPETDDVTGGIRRFREEGADMITFRSSSTVENFLALQKLHPEIGIESCRGNALQDGGRHPRYLKPNAFLPERVNKPCERRNCSWVLHLSSGVMVRLRAKRMRSLSLSVLTFFKRRSSRSNFFCSRRSVCAAALVLSRNAGSFVKTKLEIHSTT